MSATGQYATTTNLNVRMALHQHFSTNPQGWVPWIWTQVGLRAQQRILEVGCGTGSLWAERAESVPEGVRIVLSDTSRAMLRAAQTRLGGRSAFSVMAADAQCLCFADGAFDVVLANHMLYHVADRGRALAEIARVLAPSGALYATTPGRGNLSELGSLLSGFDARIAYSATGVTEGFCLENGAAQLAAFFGSVTLLRYPDSLHVTEPGPLVDYVLSLRGTHSGVDAITPDRADAFRGYIGEIIAHRGAIDIRKDAGMFIAAEPLG